MMIDIILAVFGRSLRDAYNDTADRCDQKARTHSVSEEEGWVTAL